MAPYTWLCSVPIGATPCPTESPGAASMPVKPSLPIKFGSRTDLGQISPTLTHIGHQKDLRLSPTDDNQNCWRHPT
jgi:hypothetical protein